MKHAAGSTYLSKATKSRNPYKPFPFRYTPMEFSTNLAQYFFSLITHRSEIATDFLYCLRLDWRSSDNIRCPVYGFPYFIEKNTLFTNSNTGFHDFNGYFSHIRQEIDVGYFSILWNYVSYLLLSYFYVRYN